MSLKSKEELFKVLDEVFTSSGISSCFSKQTLNHNLISDETYGDKSYVYVNCKHENVRRKIEAELEKKGFVMDLAYHPGSGIIAVNVSYFKGQNWDI